MRARASQWLQRGAAACIRLVPPLRGGMRGLGRCASLFFFLLLLSVAYADPPADSARALQNAREKALKQQAAPAKDAGLFVCQLDAGLFEAEKALRDGKSDLARQRAERVLAGVESLADGAAAAKFRARAEAVLAAASKVQERTATDRQQADIAAARDRAHKDQAAALRALSEQGWKHFERGRNEQALAAAEEMLRIQPGNRDALFLRHQSLLGSDPTPPPPSKLRAERRKAEDSLIKQISREMAYDPDILTKIVREGEKDPKAAAKAPKSTLPAWEEKIRAKLKEPILAEFQEATLPEACRYLSELTDTTILVDPSIARSGERYGFPRMTLAFGHWLSWVCRYWGVTFVLRDHAILVTSRGGLLDDPIARQYDIAELLLPARTLRTTFNGDVQGDDTAGGKAMVAALPNAEPFEPPPSKDTIGEGWARFLRATIAPDTWDVHQEKQQYTIAYRNGRIVVVHTPEVQDQVQRLLDNFRRARTLQVHVVCRFLQVRTDFLQQLDLDFGNAIALGFDTRPGASPSDHNAAFGKLVNSDQVPLAKGGLTPTGGLRIGFSTLDDGALNAFLTAILKRRKGTLLVAPRLTCFNTQRANFQSITNFNYVRSISADNEPEIGNVPDGIVFDIQPFVSADRRYITLVLQPQLRTLLSLATFEFIRPLPGLIGPERFVQQPVVELKSLATTVTIPDGGSVIAGGLSDATDNRGEATVPFVNRIPVVEYIFRGWTQVEARTSLIIIVTAQIVPDIFENE